jgi:lipoprotein signal peptidase
VKRSLELLVVAGIAIADQVTKLLVVTELGLLQTVTVIPGLLNLTHVRNSASPSAS